MDFLALHPSGTVKELKTSAFINGSGKWSQVPAGDRKKFLRDVCTLATDCSSIYGIGISFIRFTQHATDALPCKRSYFQAAAMFTAGIIQKKMQKEAKNKGLTVLVFDDHAHMPSVSDALYRAEPWYDPIYQYQVTKRGRKIWSPLKKEDRFNQIINTAFSTNSEHSSLVQVADAVAYVYRRHLELLSGDVEKWTDDGGEKAYYAALVNKLDTSREKLGRTPSGTPCINFYESILHPNWQL